MTETKRPLKVFLCHAHSDKNAVKALYTRLTNDGVDAWLDKERLLPGQDWEFEIRKAVREADVVVVCLSKQFNQAGFRQKEVRLALDTAMEKPEGEIFIIPARLEECEPLESLRKWHWVDLFEDDGYEMLMRALRKRANNIKVALQVKKSWLPKISTPRKSEAPVNKKPKPKQHPLKADNPKPRKVDAKKTILSGKPNTAIIVALIGLVGTICAALISSPLLATLFDRTPEPTMVVSVPTETTTPTPSNTPTKAFTPTQTKTSIPSKTPTRTFTPTPIVESVVGEWLLLYDWKCDGDPDSTPLIFYEDGTTNSAYNTSWNLQGENIIFIRNIVTYTGKVAGNTMEGTMEIRGGNSGCWNAQRK